MFRLACSSRCELSAKVAICIYDYMHSICTLYACNNLIDSGQKEARKMAAV
jgi:hypothetical protein